MRPVVSPRPPGSCYSLRSWRPTTSRSSSSSSRTTRTSTRARRATRSLAYWRHVERGGKMFWAVAGAMSSAQLGITLAPAIRAGLIHGMSVTGANLEESLFRLVAQPQLQGLPRVSLLHEAGRHEDPQRAHAPRDRHAASPRTRRSAPSRSTSSRCGRTRPRRASAASGTSTSTSSSRPSAAELHEGNRDECWLLAAAKAKLPIVVPGYEDSTFGNIFASHVKLGECSAHRRQVGHRVHGRASTTSIASSRPARASASSRSAAASPATSRSASCRRSSTTSSRAGQAVGLLLPDLGLDDVLRLVLGRDAEREDHLGQADRRRRRCS